jgi:hypothetical protein
MTGRQTQFWLPTLLYLLLLIVGPSQARGEEPVKPKTKDAVSGLAVKFVRSWSKHDYASVQPLVDFPFFLYLPCKNAPITTWDEFPRRMDYPGLEEKSMRVKEVVTVATYLRSLGAKDRAIQKHMKELGEGVYAVYLCEVNQEDACLAVLVRVTPKTIRATGLGGVSP